MPPRWGFWWVRIFFSINMPPAGARKRSMHRDLQGIFFNELNVKTQNFASPWHLASSHPIDRKCPWQSWQSWQSWQCGGVGGWSDLTRSRRSVSSPPKPNHNHSTTNAQALISGSVMLLFWFWKVFVKVLGHQSISSYWKSFYFLAITIEYQLKFWDIKFRLILKFM